MEPAPTAPTYGPWLRGVGRLRLEAAGAEVQALREGMREQQQQRSALEAELDALHLQAAGRLAAEAEDRAVLLAQLERLSPRGRRMAGGGGLKGGWRWSHLPSHSACESWAHQKSTRALV